MSSLSVVLIVKNEQESIIDCLQSIADLADEIIVLDAGSEDKTVELCQNFAARVYRNTPWPGYGRQRQIAQSYATREWVFMLDADEHFTKQSREEIKRIVQQNNQNTIWQIPRLSQVFGRFIRHSGWYPDYVIRLYPRAKAQYNDALVHEKVIYPSTMELKSLKYPLLHYTYKDVHDYLTKSANYAQAWAQQKAEKGRHTTISNALLHGIACFIKMYLLRAGFLDGKQGFVLAILSAHSTFVKYLDLWVRSQKKSKD